MSKEIDEAAESVKSPTTISRRALVGGACAFASTFALGGVAYAFSENNSDSDLLRPPSAQDETHFIANCLKCNRCESICPQSCIRVGTLEDGLLNWRTPIMDFHRGACDFCGKCEDVCPTRAIYDARNTSQVIGHAVVDTERCLAWQQGGCRVCVDACPYSAIELDSSGRPQVLTEACNGCGACEYECPSNSYRSFAGGTQRGINVCVVE